MEIDTVQDYKELKIFLNDEYKKEIFSSIRLRQIINDLKRRPEDASKI